MSAFDRIQFTPEDYEPDEPLKKSLINRGDGIKHNPMISWDNRTVHLDNPANGKTFCGQVAPTPVIPALSFSGKPCKKCKTQAENAGWRTDDLRFSL